MDIPDTTPPNGPLGYTHTETRTEPPLSYVAEKMRGCLHSLHSLYRLTLRDVPEGLPCPERFETECPDYDPQRDSVLGPCLSAFRYAAISYLALNNLLALSNEPDVFKRLLAMSDDDFEKWLENIGSEGSVT